MILHICPRADWTPDRPYRPASLDDVGFVHCSDFGTAHLPANRLFAGRDDLVLLVIDPVRLPVALRWEESDPPDPAGVWFPHVFGAIPPEAVVAVHDFPPSADGTFRLPAALAARDGA